MKTSAIIKFLLAVICLSSVTNVSAQRGYAEDSLQIKVYSEIVYDKYEPTKITVTKIFCDYCSENQLKHVKEIAWEMAYKERNAPENVMAEGKKRLAIYLRVPKEKFRLLRDEQRRR
ncbi:MAG: hypothetical protein R3213_04120 [Flavobacteriaceae bacterium]|nr:hypothetical protein [Flavobacteriaceae bacterium]